MKRLFLILLLALLPLQYAWAAAAAYCDHEAGKSTHFGHHSHQAHDGAEADNHDAPAKKHQPAKVHADCAACQFGQQAWLDAQVLATLPMVRAAWPPQATILFTSHIAEGRQRPDWQPAA